jgi:hypothetical protein
MQRSCIRWRQAACPVGRTTRRRPAATRTVSCPKADCTTTGAAAAGGAFMLLNISTNKQKQGKEKSSYVMVVLVVLVVLVLVLVLWLLYKSQHSKTEQCEGGDCTEKS